MISNVCRHREVRDDYMLTPDELYNRFATVAAIKERGTMNTRKCRAFACSALAVSNDQALHLVNLSNLANWRKSATCFTPKAVN